MCPGALRLDRRPLLYNSLSSPSLCQYTAVSRLCYYCCCCLQSPRPNCISSDGFYNHHHPQAIRTYERTNRCSCSIIIAFSAPCLLSPTVCAGDDCCRCHSLFSWPKWWCLPCKRNERCQNLIHHLLSTRSSSSSV